LRSEDLHKLPVDALKIDRSFVKSLLLPGRPAIVESIRALARTLNTSVVAEGIDEELQARELARSEDGRGSPRCSARAPRPSPPRRPGSRAMAVDCIPDSEIACPSELAPAS